jgi:hypothetical protein
LLRAVTAFPVILPVVFPQAQVQTVHVNDVADAVVAAARGEIPPGTIADLTEAGMNSFGGSGRSDAALAGAACTLVAACRADSGCFRPGSGGGCLGPSWMAVPVANGGAQGLARGHHWRSRPLAKGGRSAVQGP